MFRVTVSVITPKPESSTGYDRENVREVFAQSFEAVDVAALARFLNSEDKP